MTASRFNLRVWDGKRMHYGNVEGICDEMWYCDPDGSVVEFARAWLCSPDHRMQSTGVADRHGAEVYEGDVVRDDHGEWFVVGWKNGAPCLLMPYDMWKYCTHPDLADLFATYPAVGNIYENPELLEGDDAQ